MKSAGGGAGDGDGADASGREWDQWTLFIDLPVLEAATAGFSDRNLLGRGGFGPVYKGVMKGGQEIAVKRLSLESRQGVREFLNEVRLLLKVQHRNLVSLLGCCAAAGQKMLVYPYFPNGSLDHILFDDKDEIASADSVKFQSVFSQVETLHQHVQKHREQIADAGAFLDITTSLVASVRSQSALGIIPGHLQL